ncbi:MAG: ATP synthase F0 subunit B [Desulfobacterales bacterium]|jgi:F-type H+-transporting ATPase subunit b
MSYPKQIVLYGCCLSVVLIALFISGPDALAAENAENWRSTYDLVMRWVNFAIIVTLLVKFAKTPLRNFLSDKKGQIEKKIKAYEQQKEAVEQKIVENQKMLADSLDRFEKIRQTIIESGERKKQQIIEDAQRESQMLLEATRHKIEHQIREARDAIRAELIEQAIGLAEKRLPAEITAADQQKLTDLFLTGTIST